MKNIQLNFFKYTISIFIKKNKNQNIQTFNAKLKQLKFLQSKFNFLNFINLKNINNRNIDICIDMFNELIPLYNNASKAAGERNILFETLKRLDNSSMPLIYELKNKISERNFVDNVIDRTYENNLAVKIPKNKLDIVNDVQSYENEYGAKILTGKFNERSRDKSLIYFFTINKNLFKLIVLKIISMT